MKLNPELLIEMKQQVYDKLYKQLHQQYVELQFEVACQQALGKSEKEISSTVAPRMAEYEATKTRLKILGLMLEEAKPLEKKEGGRTHECGILLYHPTARKSSEGNNLPDVRHDQRNDSTGSSGCWLSVPRQ